MVYWKEPHICVDYQYGFRTEVSCESQLVVILENIARARYKGHSINVLILDYSKAFDTVPHDRLMTTIRQYGIGGYTSNWTEAWQTNRTQQEVLDGRYHNQYESGLVYLKGQ